MPSKILITIVLISVVFVVSFLVYINGNGFRSEYNFLNPIKASLQASPSPFPFQELTIPYLRVRQYQSNLGNLDQISEDQNYNSFLTNYLSDGLKINGLITKPNEEMPVGGWPAIVFIHGYIAPTIYKTTQNYGDYVDYFARNGFVVFKIDLRGHDQSEGEAGGAYYSSDYIIDTLNAYSALANSEFVNPGKIGLWGHSMAGNVVFRSLVSKPEIKAAVIWAGAVYSYEDIQKLGINDNSYRPQSTDTQRQRKRQQLFATYGQFSKDSSFWKMVAPTNYINDLKGAIQIHHAVDDSVVSIEYSRGLMKLLDQTTMVHNLYEYSGGGHNLTDPSFTQAMEKSVEFFKKYLED